MSSHANNDNIQALYEGDQSKLYSGVMSHHSDVESTESKTQIKKIWKVFWVLLAITIVEVFIGMQLSHSVSREILAFVYLSLTLVKAGFIVYVFMHLGDEKKNFMVTVLIPLVLFVWFIIAFLADGSFWLHMNDTSKARDHGTEQIAK
ncbi:cytochrome C oxidase subunit IV family protein [Flavipsychrobacter stenotrophus]|nr:cytochrome C oxidase subunit IV family protein [Flavipsychrobacter stenotrophus]